MNIFDFPPFAAALSAASAGLSGLGSLVTPALAIVLVTLAIRAALIPVGISLAKTNQARAKLAPQLAVLQKKWAKNPERLQRETMALYASAKVSPFAGCLPVLLQAPVLTLVYALFASPVIAGAPNALLGHTLFGAPLGLHLTSLFTGFSASDIVLLVVIIAIALVAWLSRRTTQRQLAANPAAASPTVGVSAGVAKALSWAPFLTVIAACFVPLAAALYLAVSTTWSLVERRILAARYPAHPTPPPAAAIA
jgi:YidC/Oxa1 family membrane protein insertase